MGINIKPSGFVRLPAVPPPQLLGRGVLSVGPNPPIASEVGDLWWRTSSDAALYIWYDDGSSAQWVAATPGIASQPPSPSQPGYIVFPNTPLVPGQQFTATNGVTYQWDGQVWVSLSSIAIPPNTIGPDEIFPTGSLFNGNFSGLPTNEQPLLVSAGQRVLLTQDLGETRYGPILISGSFPLQVVNSGAPIGFTLDIHAVIFGVAWPIIAPTLQWVAEASSTRTFLIPMPPLLNCGGNFSGNFSGTTISILAQKMSGSDSGLTITCRTGNVSLTEFA